MIIYNPQQSGNRMWDSGITLESTHVGKPIEKYLLGMVEIYTNHENGDDLETFFLLLGLPHSSW